MGRTDQPSQETINRSAAIRVTGLTDEQRERRRIIKARSEALFEHGIKRGPNAPACGTYGKVKS